MTQFDFPLGGDLLDGDRYLTWDAAYVLGSLSSNERREYEAHLETCPRCRAAVAELSGMPALLAKLDLEDVRALDEEPSETPPLRPEVLDSVLEPFATGAPIQLGGDPASSALRSFSGSVRPVPTPAPVCNTVARRAGLLAAR